MASSILGKIALRMGTVALAAALLTACATPPPTDDPEGISDFEQLNDPLEPANRVIFTINSELDDAILRPVALGYRAVVPPFGRDRVSDFLLNLKSPLILGNDLLQGNLSFAFYTVSRFALNSTFGVFGIMDVAASAGIPPHGADFGETLGVWGIGEGPYLVLPLFGPSNPRDAVGIAVEWAVDPVDLALTAEHMKWLSWTRTGVTVVVQRESYLEVLDDVQRTSLDYYSALRSLYRQRRAAEINFAKHPDKAVPPPSAQLPLSQTQQQGAQLPIVK